MRYTSKIMLNGQKYEFAEEQWKYTPNANTVLYMPLDGNVTDYSSYNRSFTVLGSTSAPGDPVFDTLSNGKKVANFVATSTNNSNWFAYTTNVNDIPNGGDMTLSCYMNLSGVVDYMELVSLRNEGNTLETDVYTWMAVINSAPKFLFHGSSQEITNFTPIAGTWYHIVCTVTGGSNCAVYCNGTQIYTDTYSYGNPASVFSIGAYYSEYYSALRHEAYNGKLSEVIIENKARTAQEREDYYNQTKSLYGIS